MKHRSLEEPARRALPVIDLSGRAFWDDPASALTEARRRSDLARTPGGQLLVLSYREVERLLADPTMVTVGRHLLDGIGIREGPLADWWRLVMFNTNPPEHTRLRSLVSRAFTPNRTERLRPSIRNLAEELCEGIAQRGAADFVEAFAHHLPIRVICSLLGLPREEWDAIAGWTASVGSVFATRMTDERRVTIEGDLVALQNRLHHHIEQRRVTPHDDLLADLVSVRDQGDQLSSNELVAMAVNLLFAGHDTTRGFLSIGLATLLAHPAAMAELVEHPALIPAAVEELLRFEAPTLGSLRAAQTEREIAGVPVRAGEPINLLAIAANRDPAAFDDPDRFDIHRRGPRSLSFGLGVHFCLGAALARAEAEESLSVVLERFASIRLALPAGESPTFVPFATIRQIHSLPIEVTARTSA
jgi:hypothetical protein